MGPGNPLFLFSQQRASVPPGSPLASSSGCAFSVNRVVFLFSSCHNNSRLQAPPSQPWVLPAPGARWGDLLGQRSSLAETRPPRSKRRQEFSDAHPMGQVGGGTSPGVHQRQRVRVVGAALSLRPTRPDPAAPGAEGQGQVHTGAGFLGQSRRAQGRSARWVPWCLLHRGRAQGSERTSEGDP